MIKTISQAILFALGILIGFIGGLAISKKESRENLPLCVSSEDGEHKDNNGNNSCRQKR